MPLGGAAIIAAIIAAFGSTNAFYVSMFEVFPSGVASLVSMMFWVFTVSGLLGFLMDETGCSKAVGNQMIKWLGKDRAWMAISATAVILMLAGVGHAGIYRALANEMKIDDETAEQIRARCCSRAFWACPSCPQGTRSWRLSCSMCATAA